MRAVLAWVLVLFLGGCATMQSLSPEVSILVDLDPASANRTVIVESITADKAGRLYLPDRVTGNVLRVDPKSSKPVVVGRIETREIKGKKIAADPAGIAFNRQGDLFVAVAPYGEVVRIRGAELNPGKPGLAQTFATDTAGANGGTAQVAYQIEPYTRTLPNGKTQQSIVANGLEFDAKGVLHVADTARGAIWRVDIGADCKSGKPTLLAQSPLLEGADGLAFDPSGKLWVAANERNALVTVTADGQVQQVAKNGSQGPLEFPSAIVFIGNTGYVSNYDTPRPDNMDANGKTALDGIGASIARITP